MKARKWKATVLEYIRSYELRVRKYGLVIQNQDLTIKLKQKNKRIKCDMPLSA